MTLLAMFLGIAALRPRLRWVHIRHPLRRYLPRVAFYGITALLTLAHGASVVLYLN